MDFFNKVGETITNKGKDVTKKVKDIAEIGNLNGQISVQEEIIQNLYFEMGKMFYEDNKEKEDTPYQEKCQQIKEAYGEIDRLKTAIQNLKGIQVCPKCGAELKGDAVFCSMCGEKVNVDPEVVVEEEEEEIGYCSNCGNKLEKEAVFCTKCGTKVK